METGEETSDRTEQTYKRWYSLTLAVENENEIDSNDAGLRTNYDEDDTIHRQSEHLIFMSFIRFHGPNTKPKPQRLSY